MGIPEEFETIVKVEAHGQRWGHRWTATAEIYAEHPQLGTWRIERRYHALPGYDPDKVHAREAQLKIETGGLHLNTESQYHGTPEWRELPVPVDDVGSGALLNWITDHYQDDLDELLKEYVNRVAVCERCGRTASRAAGRELQVRFDDDGTRLLCDDCYE